jgi:hypothetical protein
MPRRVRAARYGALVVAIVSASLVLSGCAGGSKHESRGGVLFVIGASTDPYGSSHPNGFGIAIGVGGDRIGTVMERDDPRWRHRPWPEAVTWLGGSRLVISNPAWFLKGPPASLFTFRDGRLESLHDAPVRPGELTFAWSPNQKLIATQPWLRSSCGPGARPELICTRSGHAVFVERSDGSDRRRVAQGLLRGWTPDGKLLAFTGENSAFARGAFLEHDLRTDRTRVVLSSQRVSAVAHQRVQLGELAYSTDGRYLAAKAMFGKFGSWGIVIANAEGRIVRVIKSRDQISMFAWSPRGHRLAYTTSGFPAPHELFVLLSPSAQQRRILSQAPHFDWVTWSPDDRWLLVDNENRNAWTLLRLTGHHQVRPGAEGAAVPTRRLPRLGGMPLWCCPQQSYGGA